MSSHHSEDKCLCTTCHARYTAHSKLILPMSALQAIQRDSVHNLPPQQILDIRNNLEQAEAYISTLRGLIRGLEGFTSQAKTILCPMRWLPNEVISLIFMQVCFEATRDPVRPNPSKRLTVSGVYAPIVLSSICKRWRDIALSTPHIWTFIYAPPPRSVGSPPPEHASLHDEHVIPTYLERSGVQPLNIDVATQNDQLVRDIAKHAYRWGDALFNMTTECTELLYRTVDPDAVMDKLTSLTFVDLVDIPDSTGIVPLFQHAKNLHMLCLGGAMSEPAAHPLPYENIHSLVLSWMSDPVAILRVIGLCLRAYHLSISDVFMEYNPGPNANMPMVETRAGFVSFRVSKTEEAKVVRLLPYIRAPAMFSLKLALWDGKGEVSPEIPVPVFKLGRVVEFVQESSAKLRRLEIAGVRVSEQGLIALLDLSDTIEELYVQHPRREDPKIQTPGPAMGAEFVRRMTLGREQEGESPLVPNVKNILLHWQGTSTGIRRIDVLRMIASRAIPSATRPRPEIFKATFKGLQSDPIVVTEDEVPVENDVPETQTLLHQLSNIKSLKFAWEDVRQ
ncbi:hypothetical protein CYLTODRAFT_440525 [Cylindrobasidium torrendii FP15055 ss-10]|uniref:Uncharacterized protein n=1 Tax=Cylindrobasidium torrendii FP15055 ss-10 TaxID=1314674 RepID=A0A0D7BQW3_9AGAR|nr:hypothetical protein CYLTODRAFT_440525 [Cylindrobasidium torrendii FP15055 ss-10]